MRYEDLKILDELREKGSITEEEYQREKARLLNEVPPAVAFDRPWGIDERTFLVLMHLSQFVSAFLLPLAMWLTNSQNKNVDQHGKNIMNFVISYTIYSIISAFLIIIVVGIVLLVVIGIMVTVFIIIAAIKAANGEAWKYPLTIEFLK